MDKPQSIADEIVAVVGEAAAVRFFGYYGGKVVKIPVGTGKPGQFTERLIELIGEECCSKLIQRFSGECISVPKGHIKAKALASRNRQIVAEYLEGFSMLDLVHKYDLCERQIRNILGRPVE